MQEPGDKVPSEDKLVSSDSSVPGRLADFLRSLSRRDSIRNKLLEQFIGTLRVTFLANEPSSAHPAIADELHRQLAKDDFTWQEAYDIEIKLVHLMSPAQLEVEWGRRAAEAQALGLPYVEELKQHYAEATSDISGVDDLLARKKALMHRLVNDLQWFYQKRMSRREMAKILANRISLLFWLAFILFAGVLYMQFIAQYPPRLADSQQADQEQTDQQ